MSGLISGLFGGFGAGSKAASASGQFIQQGVQELRPFADAGTGQLESLTGGATVGGLDARLAELLNTDIFGSLVDERTRGVQGQLAAGGLTRSGTALDEISKIGPDLALALESLLTGRSQFLSGQGASAAGGIADLFSQRGQVKASGILADQQAKSAAIGDVVNVASSIFFSDRRLKENAVQVSEIMGLPVYQWDWISQTEGTIIEHGPTMGFMADEVRERYPHLVGEYSGWLFVDLDGVLNTLTDEMLEERKCLH